MVDPGARDAASGAPPGGAGGVGRRGAAGAEGAAAHYLDVLGHRPGAFTGSTALVRARADGTFTASHQRFWDAARRQHGDRDGTRALIGALLLHRTLPTEAVLAGIDAAVQLGRCDPDPVAVEARRHLDDGRRAGTPPAVPVPPAATAVDERPVPTLDGYDELLQARA